MEIIQFKPEDRLPDGRDGASSKGDQPKWRSGDFWYKADHMGYEGAAEVVVSKLLECSNVPDFVSYRPVRILADEKTYTGCVSRNFRNEGQMLVTFERLHRSYTGRSMAAGLTAFFPAEEKLRYVAEFVEAKTGLSNVGAYLTMLLELDAFFLNEDRHMNNLAVIRDERTGIFSFCPVFDNGLSLLSDTGTDYPMGHNIYELIKKVRAKPFKEDFFEQMDAAETLWGIQLHLRFSRQDVQKAVSCLEPYYPMEVRERIQCVLLEQMRKYPIFFA